MTRRYFIQIASTAVGTSMIAVIPRTRRKATYQLQVRMGDDGGPAWRYVDQHGKQLGEEFTVGWELAAAPVPDDLFLSVVKDSVRHAVLRSG
jgi:hypothetical protein